MLMRRVPEGLQETQQNRSLLTLLSIVIAAQVMCAMVHEHLEIKY